MKADMNSTTEKKTDLVDCNSRLFDDLVVFDLETTGLSPLDSEIIQIAASRIRCGKILDEPSFFSYVKPGQRISSFITEYTGITDEDVADAPGILDVLKNFSVYCGDSVLVAHNGHRFDIPFVEAACPGRKRRKREVRYIDSMHLSWQVWGRARGTSHSLDNVVRRLRIRRGGIRRHDARGDVELTARCVIELLERIKRADKNPKFKVYTSILPAW
jgi:DNA polymerase III epsilon subunit family exonuclease